MSSVPNNMKIIKAKQEVGDFSLYLWHIKRKKERKNAVQAYKYK